MSLLLKKELALATSKLAWWFLLFSLMAFLPGYPIMMAAFFICMGIFQSVQMAREAQDTLYSALLPIAKRDVVTAKYQSALLFEGLGFVAIVVFAAIRMTVLSGNEVYLANALLPANLTYLAGILVIYAAFNVIFLGGFFKTAYYYGKPFIIFIVAALVIIGGFEAIWHVPALGFLGEILPNWGQAVVLVAAVIVFIVATWTSLKASQRSFESIDL